MCGIAGIICGNIEGKDDVIKGMVDLITHRGPDEDGIYSDEKMAFGMRRLSIIDLSGGHQPIWNETGDIGIVFNGEIYNYEGLKVDLEKKGHKFKTHSDTEVLVHLYEEYDEKMLVMLRGMFAFSIYDKKKNEMFIARDYFGIKPLYYLLKDGKFLAYGSEIKSLLFHPLTNADINHDAVFNYLSYQYNPLKETFFKNIFRLDPGSFLRISLDDKSYVEKRYWSYEFNQKNIAEEDLKKEVLERLEGSVRAHMVADVPVGAFLSGGIDSAIIVALMEKVRKDLPVQAKNKKIKTFTIGFDEVSEASEAKVMADFLETDHTEIKVSPETYFKELPKIAWHFDEPVADPSAVALYFLAKEARKQVKVVLSGEGSDELFGGYNIYREPFALSKVTKLPKFMKSTLHGISNMGINFYGKNYLKRTAQRLEDRYIGNAYIFKDEELKRLWKLNDTHKVSLKPSYQKVEAQKGGQSDSAKMQYIDINYWMPGDILMKADKMTMANSLELRVPFLDIEIAKISEQIPDSLKYKNGQTKYILREAVKGILPKETAKRKKLGFPTPVKYWLRKNPEEIFRIITDNDYIKEYFHLPHIKTLINNHIKGVNDNSRKIYVLLMLSIWYNVYIKNEKFQ